MINVFIVEAQDVNTNPPYPDYQEDVYMDMDLSDNIVTPVVPTDLKERIIDYQGQVANSIKSKYTIDLTRDDEVFVVCIPTDDLFLPNDTLFNKYAASKIEPLLKLMKNPFMYKIVIAVHTDDTGSEAYRNILSTARIYTIYDWFIDKIDQGVLSEDLIIIPYAMGSTDPIFENNTRANRKENRRLEIFFIPGPEMIKLAEKNELNFK